MERIALVTGASRGLGGALTRALAADGWTLVITARRAAALDALAAELGPRVVPVTGDVVDGAHRARLVDAVRRAGGLDLLVNNASSLGPSPLRPLAQQALDSLRAVYETNTLAPVALVQALLPELRARRGVVVNVSSDAAVEAYAGWGGYGSSKAALDQVSAVLAVEEPDVRMLSFDPGDMRTEMHQLAYPGEDISDRPDPESVVPAVLRLLADDLPSGRYRALDLLPTGAVA